MGMNLEIAVRQARLKGFTLVELSVVLVLIGLLAGGILGGQSLIRSAELRSVPTQAQKFIAASQLFVAEFNALPGDMKNATTYWGAAHAVPATCGTTASTTEATCDGDGNGIITTGNGSMESPRFWQHLANAGLIEGKFNGINTVGGTCPGCSMDYNNAPAPKLRPGIWFAWNWGTVTADAATFGGQYDNYLMIGGYTPPSWPYTAVLVPEDAYNIDIKIDDGKPGTGTIVAGQLATCTNASSGSDYASTYTLSTKTLGCTMFWLRAFRIN